MISSADDTTTCHHLSPTELMPDFPLGSWDAWSKNANLVYLLQTESDDCLMRVVTLGRIGDAPGTRIVIDTHCLDRDATVANLREQGWRREPGFTLHPEI